MPVATFSVRMDADLKNEFDILCRDFGMNMATAINIFAKTVVKERRIPFLIHSSDFKTNREDALKALDEIRDAAERNGTSEMSMDEINREIELARRESHK